MNARKILLSACVLTLCFFLGVYLYAQPTKLPQVSPIANF